MEDLVLWYIQNSVIFKTRGIFRTLVCPKRWHIQNQGNIQDPELFRTMGYSEPSHTHLRWSTITVFVTTIVVFSSYCPLVHQINLIFLRKHDSFNADLIFTSEFFIQCKKKIGGRGQRDGNCEFWYASRKFYSDIVNYFWLSIFSNLSATS